MEGTLLNEQESIAIKKKNWQIFLICYDMKYTCLSTNADHYIKRKVVTNWQNVMEWTSLITKPYWIMSQSQESLGEIQ